MSKLIEQKLNFLKSLLTEPVVGSSGTASYCKISGIDVAAKTGTTNEDKDRLNNSLLYIEQTLTEEQQKQVKQNLNLTNDVVPSIGDNGNWFIGDIDTGISATNPSSSTLEWGALGQK